MTTKMKLPIGIEFFKDMRTNGFYYVDKTGFIRQLLDSYGSVNLFTRPRRFGKSLNMDMLKTFFEIGTDSRLFDGLEIAKDTAKCTQYMGKYPVISISLKDVEGEDYEMAYDNLGIIISEEADRFDFLLDSSQLNQIEKSKFIRLMRGDFEKPAYLHNSLRLLTRLLFKHYGTRAIVLIDEYDVPLDKAYQYGYYPQMVQLIRSVFSQVLKTNNSLYFAVITGCLRIAKESIFTGLNNFKVRTISDILYAEYFGFTDNEVQKMLCYYGLEEKYDQMKEWYDGYHFGNVDVYCPWDILNQCDKFLESKDALMESHWENSSSNIIIQNILETASNTTRDQIEALISGEYVEKSLVPELTYTDLNSGDAEIRQTYLWSVLFATGYLTTIDRLENGYYKLAIPNQEILGIYEKKILSWFKIKITGNTTKWQEFCIAIKSGNAETTQALLNEFMSDSISIRDTYVKKAMKENFYHGMLLGLLKAEENWIVKSNAESGIGYTDILIEIPQEKTGCIIEMKYTEDGHFDVACAEAMKQIDTNDYTEFLRKNGIQTIHKYGIACYKKNCKIIYRKEFQNLLNFHT